MKTSKVFFMVGIVASMSLLSACSDSNDATDTPDVPVLSGIDVTSNTNAAELATRVTNYKSGTRAVDATTFAGLLSMPDEPTVDVNTMTDLKTITNLGELANGGTYYIKKGDNIDFTGKGWLKGCTIYIQAGGTMTYNGSTGGNNTIYVLHGGKLEHKAISPDFPSSLTSSNDKIYCYGEVTTDGSYFTVGSTGAAFYINGNLSFKDKKVQVQDGAGLYVNGSVRSQGFRLQTNSKANVIGKMYVAENGVSNIGSDRLEIDDNAALHVGGLVESPIVYLHNGQLTTDCYVKASTSLKIEGDNASLQANYLNVTNNAKNAVLEQLDNSKILLASKGVINVDTYKTDNTPGQVQLTEDNGVAVFKANQYAFVNNGVDDLINNISTPKENSTFLLQFKKTYKNAAKKDNNGSYSVEFDTNTADAIAFEDLNVAASYMDYDKSGVKTVLKDDKCGYELSGTDITKLPKLDIVSAIDYAHTDAGLSATCIQPGQNNNFYMSYHTRGTGHGACVEVFQRNGDNLTLRQYLKDTENDLDFNHLMVDNNRVYLAGSSVQKGAMVAYIDINGDGTLNTTEKTITTDPTTGTKKPIQVLPIDLMEKNGYDANCVVKYDKYLVVASTRGYESFDTTNDAFTHKYTATSGKAKHLAVSGTDLYGLNLDAPATSEDQALDGTLYKFVNNDFPQPNATEKQAVGQIAPNNGKNTIAIDNTGKGVFVCKSANGLALYNDGEATWEWKAPVIKNTESDKSGNVKGYCNGVAVSEKYPNYVFVACGGYGLVVLDKATGKEITHRAAATKNSANYVYVDKDGYIYVAYGQSRMQVFKLTDTAK